MFGKLLYCRNLEIFGSVAQLVEQRPFKPNSHLAPFPKNRVFPTKSTDFLSPAEAQAKPKSIYLARALARAR